jgi:hypothetical protein
MRKWTHHTWMMNTYSIRRPAAYRVITDIYSDKSTLGCSIKLNKVRRRSWSYPLDKPSTPCQSCKLARLSCCQLGRSCRPGCGECPGTCSRSRSFGSCPRPSGCSARCWTGTCNYKVGYNNLSYRRSTWWRMLSIHVDLLLAIIYVLKTHGWCCKFR